MSKPLTPSMQKTLSMLKNSHGSPLIHHMASVEALVRRGLVKKEWKAGIVVIGGREFATREPVYTVVEQEGRNGQ